MRRLTWVCFMAAIPLSSSSATTFVGPYPFAAGDSFTFAYRSTDSVRNGSNAPEVDKTAFTATTTIGAPIDFPIPAHGIVQAYPFETKGTETSAAGTLTVDNLEYRNFVKRSGGGQNYVVYGYSDSSDLRRPDNVIKHLSESLTFGSPFILDELAATAPAAWAEPIDGIEKIDDEFENTGSGTSNILQAKIDRNGDASYTNKGMDFDVPYSVVQKADGTGVLSEGPPTAIEEWNFRLPQASSGGEVIPVIVTFAGKMGKNLVPDWYPGHALPSQPLTTSRMVDRGPQVVPADCGSHAGERAKLLQAKLTQLGTVSGFTLVDTRQYYIISKIGRVCEKHDFKLTKFDAKVHGTVKSVEDFSSTMGLIKESVH